MNQNTVTLNGNCESKNCSAIISQGCNGKNHEQIIIFAGNHIDIHNNFEYSLKKYNLNYTYKIMPMENYEENNYFNQGQNIILTAEKGIDFNILRFSTKVFQIIDFDLIDMENIIYNAKELDNRGILFNIKKTSTIEILSLDTNGIAEALSLVIAPLDNNTFVKRDNLPCFYNRSNHEILSWQMSVMEDIFIKEKFGIITCELARLIYQINEYDDISSNEDIDSYFESFLGTPHQNCIRNRSGWFQKDLDEYYEKFN